MKKKKHKHTLCIENHCKSETGNWMKKQKKQSQKKVNKRMQNKKGQKPILNHSYFVSHNAEMMEETQNTNRYTYDEIDREKRST